jgi:DNA repair photolyase
MAAIKKTHYVEKYNYGSGVVDLGEYIISFAVSCNLGCEYCYLRYSKAPKKPVLYNLLEENFSEEIEILFSSSSGMEKIFYFNTGETTDSLLTMAHFEELYKMIEIIREKARKYNVKCFIELRTKTENIFKIGKIPISDESTKVIYTATLAPQNVIEKFEKDNRIAPLQRRIDGLGYALSCGLLVGIRLEPIIFYPIAGLSYKEILNSIQILLTNYKALLHSCKDVLDSENFHSLAFSTLRLTKEQYRILKDKGSELCFPEMFLCPDGKYRYSRPIRVTIYKELINYIKSTSPQLINKTLLSFEFDYIWEACKLKVKKLTNLL